MKATLVIEHRFRKARNGKIYSSSNSVTTHLWNRYLEVYEHLNVLARIQEVDEIISDNYLVEHNKVSFVPVPYYVGAKGFILKYFEINRVIKAQIKMDHAYICRVPSILGTLLISKLTKVKVPYVVEVVGDPWDVFAPGSLKNAMSFIHRYRSYSSLKRNVKLAIGVIYVTEETLQKRYPANINAVVTHASNVVLRKEAIADKPKSFSNKESKILKLLSIGSLEQLYKSPDIILKALSILTQKGLDYKFTWLGEGKYRKDMVLLATDLGIQNNIIFKGNVTDKEVFKELRNADLYIQVSRTEGLPRSIIEAMSQGLPCIGTNVGGIPELIDKKCLIEKNDIDSLVDKILFCNNNPSFVNQMAKINLDKAKEYEFTLLTDRRNKVYNHLKSVVK